MNDSNSIIRIRLNQFHFTHSNPSSSLQNLLVEPETFEINKGTWSVKEIKKLFEAVKFFGENNWKGCSSYVKTRTAKQCRDKYCYDLNPCLNKGSFEKWEDDIIIQQFKIIGKKWSIIANYLPGRTACSVKNRWYSYLYKFVKINNFGTIIY
jgi:hypothetical protein